MRSLDSLPLQSAELGRYAAPVSCFMCDAENRFDSVRCARCHAPLSLGNLADRKQAAPQILAVLGAAGAGKSCYLGLLIDMLSRSTTDLEFLARGACSVSLQQQTISALARREFPPTTATDPEGWSWVHCGVRSRRRKISNELLFPDVSGDVILGEVEAPRTALAIRRLLTHGAGAMVLIGAEELASGSQKAEFATMKIISDLLSTATPKRTKRWSERPVAIVFTKADRCDWALDAPEEFARRHALGLWRQCRHQLHRLEFFAASVAAVATACDAYGDRWNVPLRVEPRGVLEPFSWLIDQL